MLRRHLLVAAAIVLVAAGPALGWAPQPDPLPFTTRVEFAVAVVYNNVSEMPWRLSPILVRRRPLLVWA